MKKVFPWILLGLGLLFFLKRNSSAKALNTPNIKEIIRQEARRYSVPECILLGIAKAESSLNPKWFYRYHGDRVSYGAFGLTKGAVKTIGMDWESVKRDLRMQARASAVYLRWLYNRLKNWDLVIQAYNIGIGNVLRGRRNYAYLTRVKKYGGC